MLQIKHRFTNPYIFENKLQEIIKNGEVPYKLNYKKFTVDIKKNKIDGMDYYILNSQNKENKNKIMYFHGGAYISQPTPQHWKMLNKIAKDTKTEIWVPIYPKIPFHNAEYTYKSLIKMYEVFSDSVKNGEIILMGDSAGGGLVLGMAQKIRDMNKKQPIDLIMISPWLDVTMTSPDIKEIEPKDAMLGSNGLRKYGELWAGDKDRKNPMVSPLYGDLKGLGRITVFTGTYDIVNVDSRNLLKKAKEQKIPIDFVEKEHMGHVYPILPIREAKEAIKKIETIVIGKFLSASSKKRVSIYEKRES